MKHRQYLTYIITLALAMMFSCQKNPVAVEKFAGTYNFSVTGTVVNLSATPLDSVRIVLWYPLLQDTTKSDGTFSIKFSQADTVAISDSITFSRSGWLPTTKYFTFSPSDTIISLGAIALKGVTSKQDSLTTSPASQRAGQIVFIGSSEPNLSILGAGGANACTLTFEVRDSLGVPVDTSNQVNVNFVFINQLDAQLGFDSVHTNSAGQVTVQLSSGLKAGIASVQASAGVKDKSNPAVYDTIRSAIVSVPIYGGYPDSAHFSIGSSLFNVPGGVIINFQDKISVLVGDKYGNPVHPGTPVYFSTTGGIIEGQGQTDNDGIASVTLFTGNTVPSNGFAIVTAQVATSQSAGSTASVGSAPVLLTAKGRVSIDNFISRNVSIPKPLANHVSKVKPQKVTAGPILSDSMPILFSGRTVMASSTPNFIIPVGSSAAVNYTVSDLNGNPLTGGTTVQVTASGPASSDVTMTGDVTVNIPDTQNKNFTAFQVSLKDNRTTGLNASLPLTLTVAVTSQNGNGKMIITGNLSGTGGITVDSSVVSRIVVLNPSPDSIYVAGVGGINTDVISFKVYNTFGLPAKNVPVTFNLPLTLGGGEYLSPSTATTDTGGNVKTTLVSGTKFGEVAVTASTTKDSITLSSNPKVVYIIIPPSSRLASQVLYLGATATDIFVDGVGALENSTIRYQVTDSLGIPIDRQRRVGVTYNIQFFPNSTIAGGTPPSVIPSTDSTDDNGQLHTSVVSGTEAGVVQVVAHINVPGRTTLISQPVKITVHAGFADQAHFTLLGSRYVFGPWNSSPPSTVSFGVAVGDTFSNPVALGTAVYFHSQAGVIQTGNGAYTDLSGTATVNLLLVNPLPFPSLNPASDYKPVSGPYAALIGGRNGYFWVYAQTQGHNLTNVLDSLLVVGGVGPITVTGIPDTVVPISAITNLSPSISITVKDGNGNPLPDGTTITASILPPANPPSGFGIGTSGDISTSTSAATIPNAAFARFPGPLITDFTFQVVNQSAPSTVAAGVTVTVNLTISAPGIGSAIYSFNAIVQ
ncbi:MAG: Ig-like domain-containing protein [Bacteroidota bacterium]